MPDISCPNCRAVMQVPEAALGKRGTCKKCKTGFVAVAATTTSVQAPPPLPTPPLPAPPLPSANVPAKNLTTKSLPTVVARRSGPARASRPLHVGWVIGAIAALLVPILAASGLTFIKPGKPKEPSVTYAGIEIGSNGPRYVVVEYLPVTKQGSGYRFLSNQQTSARLTEGMEKSGTFNEQELRRTGQSVKAFYNQIIEKFAVAPERIVIVSSDGLFGPISSRGDLDQKEKDRLIQKCRDTLSAVVQESTGLPMEFASRRQVTEHQLKAVVRPGDLHDAVFLDVGGGGTRGGYSDAAGLIAEIQGPGIRKFVGAVKDGLEEDASFAARAKALSPQHLTAPFREGFGKDPEFSSRGKVYLAGGISWVMANCQHPEDPEDYVRLWDGDVKAFAERVHKTPDLLTTIQPPGSLPEERREWVKKEYARMRNAFKSPEGLIAGAEILLELSSELKFAGRDIWFYRHSDFAWLASYINETHRTQK